MLDFKRSARPGDARNTLKPAVSGTSAPAMSPDGAPSRPMPPSPAVAQEPATVSAPPVAAPAGHDAGTNRTSGSEPAGSRLIVGPNIKLKGVEISDCDVLVVEGQVEATVHSKAMQIAKPGTLKGVADIDVAEVDGTFTGELTAHRKLIVNSTGRVSGTVRYGCLVVAEGGELPGDVERIDPASAGNGPARPPARPPAQEAPAASGHRLDTLVR